MTKNKIRIIAIALLTVILSLATQGTLSYYSTAGTARNIVTSGNIRLVIRETDGNGDDYPTDGVYIVPGDVVSKVVFIENDCDHPFYLRVKIVYGVDSEELSADDCFKLNIEEENWFYNDGWYYYKGIVDPRTRTPDVFSHVEIVGSKVDKNYIGKTLTLTVLAQAVQSENNPVASFDEAMLTLGWPAERE